MNIFTKSESTSASKFISIFFFLFLFLPKTVNAETIISQQNQENTTVSATTSQPAFIFDRNDWPSNPMTFNSVKFKFAANNSLDLNYAYIALNTPDATGTSNVSLCTQLDFVFRERTFVWTQDQTFDSTRTFAEFDFYFFETKQDCETQTSVLPFNPIDVQFRGLNNHTTYPDSLMLINGSFPTFTPYFILGSDFPFGDLEITSPNDNSFFITGTTIAISGTCKVNATNRLQLTTTVNHVFPEAFNIDCVDHEWTTDYIVPQFRNGVTIVDSSWNGQQFPDGVTNDTIYITGTKAEGDYNLSIIYPQCNNGTQCTNLKESTDKWIFRFGYNVPTQNLLSEVKYYLKSNCDDDYENCSIEESGFLIDKDPDGNGYIDTISESVKVETTQRYYRVELVNDNSSALLYSLTFTTKSSTDANALEPKAPDDLGYWGNIIKTLFLPSKGTLVSFSESVTEDLRTRVPFGYFYALSDKINTIDTAETPIQLNANFAVASTNFSIPVFDSEQTQLKNILESLAPYFSIAIWLGTVLYIYHRVRDFEI